MRWKAKAPNRWAKRFALIPVRVDDEWLWLGWYWARFCGEYVERRFSDEQIVCCGQMYAIT